MSVRWDPLLVAALARELDRTLHRARVRALVLDPESRRVLVHLRESTLAFELHPLAGWVSLLPAAEPPAEARPLPVRVRGVSALRDDSVLVFALPRVRGQAEGVELVVELIGNRWNAVVVGHRSRTIHHVLLPRDERTRSLRVGSTWEPPPSTAREGWDEPVSRERWIEVAGRAPDPDSTGRHGGADGEPGRPVTEEDPKGRRKALLRTFAWTSSVNAEAFLAPDGYEAWLESRDPEKWGAFLLRTPRGLQPYPVALPGMEAVPAASLLEAFRMARDEDERTGPERELLVAPGLVERGKARVERLRRRAAALRGELDRAGDPALLRALGDLILARYAEVPRGRERVVLEDFEGAEVEVELDPALPPDENAARYYDEAARLERARASLPGRIEKAERAVRTWEALVDGVMSGEIEAEELEGRLGPRPDGGRRGGRGRPGEGPSLPYRRFTSSGGLEIRVGRGSRANDDLTFRHASPDDIWLHVRQSPGAHVILRWGRSDNPPRRDLTEAAVLAALNSEARHAGSVPVDWTRRKHVRKPRKAAPGAVVPDRVETLFVEPDPAVAKRLGGE